MSLWSVTSALSEASWIETFHMNHSFIRSVLFSSFSLE